MFDKSRIKQRLKLFRPVWVPLILYLGMLVLVVSWAPRFADTIWGYLVVMIPLIPGIFIAVGIFRAMAQLDELERRIIFEAVALSFTLTLLLLLSLSFLSMVGDPQIRTDFILLFMAITLVIGKLWGNWRYR